jgi:membrane protease YdiL (CAAX protease family)
MADEMNKPLASPLHTASVLAILAGFSAWGAYNAARMRSLGTTHHVALYLETLAFEWLLLAFVVWGVRHHGSPLAAALGDRWSNARDLFRDIRIAALFWFASLIALGVIGKLLGVTNQRESVRFLVPHGPVEIALWVALSITAGICEEAIFRGYLQRQTLAFTRSAPAAIALSALLFGAGHIYQGYRGALVIACYGAMFGILAHWRKSVRPGMLAHAWQDTVSGILAGALR